MEICQFARLFYLISERFQHVRQTFNMGLQGIGCFGILLQLGLRPDDTLKPGGPVNCREFIRVRIGLWRAYDQRSGQRPKRHPTSLHRSRVPLGLGLDSQQNQPPLRRGP